MSAQLKPIDGGKLDVTALADLVVEARREADAAKVRYENLLAKLIKAVPVGEKGAEVKAHGAVIKLKPRIYERITDVESLRKVLPEPLFNRLVRFKADLNKRELTYVRNNEPDWYDTIARFIEVKPGKPAVTIEEA